MGAQNIKSPVGYCKIAIILLAVVVMGVGLHSHFKSSWNKTNVEINGVKVQLTLYKICSVDVPDDIIPIKIPGLEIDLESKSCPKLAMEQYFVSMVIICFILSLINLIATIMMDTSSKFVRLIDLLYHGIAALLLLVAGALYIASAEQIKSIGFKDIDIPLLNLKAKFLHGEKVAAGAITLLQAVLCGITAFLITRTKSK